MAGLENGAGDMGQQEEAGPPGSPPIEDLPEAGGGVPKAGGLVVERPKGSVKLFVGQIGREMDAGG